MAAGKVRSPRPEPTGRGDAAPGGTASSNGIDLRKRLDLALDTAAAAFPEIAHVADGALDTDARAFLKRTKFVCETALLLYACSRLDEEVRPQARISEICKELAAVARDEHTLVWMRLRPAMAPELSVAHLCLTAMGIPDAAFDAAARAVAEATTIGLPERVPWKDLEAEWHRGLGAHLPEIDVTAARLRTSLSQAQDVIFSRREDVYAFTHGLIYATDFGHSPLPLDRPRGDVIAEMESSLARCLDDDDFDLGSEVLLTWPYLRAPWSASAEFGIHVLSGVQDSIGILPSMTLRADEYEGLDSPRRRRYFFEEGYHTEYVMGLLAAACLHGSVDPPGGLHADVAPERFEASRRLYELLLPVDRTPQWEVYFRAAAPMRQAALTSFLADVGIRRAVKQSDFSRVRLILLEILPGGGPRSAAAVQGVELLGRLLPR
ncbi:hypothetical protein [Frankia sp. AgB32]|uniref:DUF6895 family protein n=1 Tax=Frankia sp. AgB32 TaxID=631119 RepID=UPI0020107E01|nr:hypothetical protein [Frankia sp. AgB32]MCK9894183.1 hypothetical protein [Frankia sp. AgB32]